MKTPLIRAAQRAFAAALALVLLAAPNAMAQETERPSADPADVESIDAIMEALYDVISGPAGERDWDRFRSLYLPGAILTPVAPRPPEAPPLRLTGIERYIEASGRYFRENSFYEKEVSREMERFGNVVQVFSTYESRHDPSDAEPFARGINSIQLVQYDDRWWIASVIWDQEREGLEIPSEYLPED